MSIMQSESVNQSYFGIQSQNSNLNDLGAAMQMNENLKERIDETIIEE